MTIGLLILAGFLIILAMYFVGSYNEIIRFSNEFRNLFAQIDIQLQRRYELIPNLVESAKKYLTHEEKTLTEVVNARNQATQATKNLQNDLKNPQLFKAHAQAEGLLNKILGQFNAVIENYPDLKADQTIQNLMEELTSTENKVTFARQAYNDSVMQYNNNIQQFPNYLIAGFFNFLPANLLIVEDPEVKKTLRVNF